jgi:hypothetical protein
LPLTQRHTCQWPGRRCRRLCACSCLSAAVARTLTSALALGGVRRTLPLTTWVRSFNLPCSPATSRYAGVPVRSEEYATIWADYRKSMKRPSCLTNRFATRVALTSPGPTRLTGRAPASSRRAANEAGRLSRQVAWGGAGRAMADGTLLPAATMRRRQNYYRITNSIDGGIPACGI